MSHYRIASIPGDGIGQEVIPAGIQVAEVLAKRFGFSIEFKHFDWSCQTYLNTGTMMPKDGLEQLQSFDAIFLGAVGWPSVPDHVSLWGLLIPIRRHFDQYVNIRPVRLLKGIQSPLAGRGPEDIDFVIVRENCEGEYSESGGRIYAGTEQEIVLQESIFTRHGTDRILRYAFDLAKKRSNRVISCEKSNVMEAGQLWKEEVQSLHDKEYKDVELSHMLADNCAMQLVRNPKQFDVILTDNLFGDMLSDEASMLTGSLGLLPSASLGAKNKDGEMRAMYEPIHGSAPDIAGKGVANPIASILSFAMALRYSLDLDKEAEALEKAVQSVLNEGLRTKDILSKGTENVFFKSNVK